MPNFRRHRRLLFFFFFNKLSLEKQFIRKVERLNVKQRRSRWDGSSFPQYFQYISNFKNPITYTFVKCGCSIYFSSILQFWYVEVRISRSISESPLHFEITRVNCSFAAFLMSVVTNIHSGTSKLNSVQATFHIMHQSFVTPAPMGTEKAGT